LQGCKGSKGKGNTVMEGAMLPAVYGILWPTFFFLPAGI
jgi:hypothetical protein